jgi:hypothetical protein
MLFVGPEVILASLPFVTEYNLNGILWIQSTNWKIATFNTEIRIVDDNQKLSYSQPHFLILYIFQPIPKLFSCL